MTSSKRPEATLTFAAADRDVLDYWFAAPDTSPSSLNGVGRQIASLGLVPQRGHAYSTPAAYTASLVLNAIRHRLPGEEQAGAEAHISHPPTPDAQNYPSPTVNLLPRFLCRLNWESRGPEACWPVDYYATWLPGYRRWVVTGSSEMPEFWGVYDVALGWFDDAESLLEGARRVLTTDWRTARKLYSPLAEEFVGKPGAIDAATAARWLADIRL